jgi:hypothetical protein
MSKNMRGKGGLLFSGLEWLMGLLFSFILMHSCSLSLLWSNLLLQMAFNFGQVVLIELYSKSSVPYTIGSAFLVAIQWYMARLLWSKNDRDIVG